MRYSIAFKDLPFVPEERQVIYVENQYDERINAIIMENYEQLKRAFCQADLEFIYLPMFFKDEDMEEKIRYYAPYLTADVIEKAELRSSFLLGFMSHVENRGNIAPSLLYTPRRMNDEWRFHGETIEFAGEINKDTVGIWIENAVSEIEFAVSEIEFEYNHILGNIDQPERRYDEDEKFGEKLPHHGKSDLMDSSKVEYSSAGPRFNNIDKHAKLRKNAKNKSSIQLELSLEEIKDEEAEEDIEGLLAYKERLRLKGMSLAAIIELIIKGEPLSRLFVTTDNRLFLPEYNNIEIELTPKFKAVYFLFLNHPEGIVLKHLEEYHKELKNYYRQMSRGELTPRMIDSIKKMEVPGNNDINIALTKIRNAFERRFDEHLAKHYIIEGTPGEPYKISLDYNLIEWEEEE